MKLSVKFSGAVLLVLAASLGATAWLVIRHQARSLQQEALERSQTVLSFGESCREYARHVSAAVDVGDVELTGVSPEPGREKDRSCSSASRTGSAGTTRAIRSCTGMRSRPRSGRSSTRSSACSGGSGTTGSRTRPGG